MAAASFDERLKRIHDANGDMEYVMDLPVRSQAEGGTPQVMRKKRKKRPLRGHAKSLMTGAFLGGVAAVLLLGLTLDASPWGPGTDLHDAVYWLAMGALALAPLLILLSVVTASTKPGFALFSLGYLTGLMVPVLM